MKTTKFRACQYDFDICALTNPIAQPLENQKHAWPLAPVRLRPGSLTAATSEGNGHQGSKGTGVGTCKTKHRTSLGVRGAFLHITRNVQKKAIHLAAPRHFIAVNRIARRRVSGKTNITYKNVEIGNNKKKEIDTKICTESDDTHVTAPWPCVPGSHTARNIIGRRMVRIFPLKQNNNNNNNSLFFLHLADGPPPPG